MTIFYDIYSILYLPNYLANAGYEIIKFDDNEQKYKNWREI
ncbi:hypothetical protein [Arcobacter porcinus]|nr:hypothetical protein [Arcobacter porcinus]